MRFGFLRVARRCLIVTHDRLVCVRDRAELNPAGNENSVKRCDRPKFIAAPLAHPMNHRRNIAALKF